MRSLYCLSLIHISSDIIAEQISDDAVIRKALRDLLSRQGQLVSCAATEEDSVYRLYYDFTQSLSKLQEMCIRDSRYTAPPRYCR